MTFPNQRSINIHREKPKADFLGIKNENWKRGLFLKRAYRNQKSSITTLLKKPKSVLMNSEKLPIIRKRLSEMTVSPPHGSH